ncbi:C-type lectin domain family 4 member M, partial [Biomphalaria pfeifferi]
MSLACFDSSYKTFTYLKLNFIAGRCNLTSNNILGRNQEIYISCFDREGFNYITIGSVSASVWVSQIETDYITARDDCR